MTFERLYVVLMVTLAAGFVLGRWDRRESRRRRRDSLIERLERRR